MEQNEDNNALEDKGSEEQCHNTRSHMLDRLAAVENENVVKNDQESHLADNGDSGEGTRHECWMEMETEH